MFIDDVTARCRKIALRLVDGKAAALAHRIEELPSRLLALPAADRPRGAVVELGKLVLLGRGFRMAPRDAESAARSLAPKRERPCSAILGYSVRVEFGKFWSNLCACTMMGRVWRTNWLLNLDGTGPRFAMLLDQVSANRGRREAGLAPGGRFVGELAFFPARNPLRALLVEREPIGADREFDWPEPGSALSGILTEPLLAEPWALDVPVLLPAGPLWIDAAGQGWWRACGDDGGGPARRGCDGADPQHRTDARRGALVGELTVYSCGAHALGAYQQPWLRRSSTRWAGADALDDRGPGRARGAVGLARRDRQRTRRGRTSAARAVRPVPGSRGGGEAAE